jgi:hypothetical protein
MTDRPAHNPDEIEVTPEMVDAGALAFSGYDSNFDRSEDLVCEIYLAMSRARSSV